MPVAISMNVARFKEKLAATVDQLHRATRPAAQAGVQIIYDRAKLNAPVSDAVHKFYGTNQVYGPYSPGNLRDSIYQVFNKSRSFKDVSTYEVSWNKAKAPYGYMVELGTSRTPAQSFIARSVVETRAAVRDAIKVRYLQEIKK